MRILITGGAGFIGSALCRYLIQEAPCVVLNLDKLTYAASLASLASIQNNERYHFAELDICDVQAVEKIIFQFEPDIIMHLAAESHVDRSIEGPAAFIQNNIIGTYALLEAARSYWQQLTGNQKEQFRFHLISTDEVYGTLGETGLFTEETPYAPNSPYAASKASADHLARAWYHTFGLPVIITNCSNNYGPYQFPEKLIPLMIINALTGKPLPIYGSGTNVRDWLYVEDHVRALYLVITQGIPGEKYNIAGGCEKNNLEVVQVLCSILDDLLPESQYKPHAQLITFVADRPGHDFRYALDTSKIRQVLGWSPVETFETGVLKTVQWYFNNESWWRPIYENKYQGQRLGLPM